MKPSLSWIDLSMVRPKNPAALVATVLLLSIPFVLLVIIEIFLRNLPHFSDTEHAIFPPLSRAEYSTSEFSFVSKINSYGFRGDDAEKKNGQIVTIGDSFTWGWGSNLEYTWQEVLKKNLIKQGQQIEVYNLGKPGGSPEDYLDIARTYIPQLKPKVVIVSILQGDDLAQLLENKNLAKKQNKSILKRGKELIKRNLPGIIGFLSRNKAENATQYPSKDWGVQAGKIINERSLHLGEDIQKFAENGDINPGLLSLVADYNNRIADAYENPSSRQYIKNRLNFIIGELNDITIKNGGQLVVVSMPSGAYADSKIFSNYRKMGFFLDEKLKTTVIQDEFIREICKDNDVNFYAYIDAFRKENNKFEHDLRFPIDGHLTKFGNKLLGDLLFGDIINFL
jgi:hypothetical protein